MKLRTLLFIGITLFFTACSSKNDEQRLLKVGEHNNMTHTNKKMSLKIKDTQELHRLHQIDENQAKEIVEEASMEKVSSIIIKHNGLLLYYLVKTQSGKLFKVNAIDGVIIENSEKL